MNLEPQSSSTQNPHAGQGVESPRERILLHPEDYVGSVENRSKELWVYESRSMTRRLVTYVPALYKIFDEILLFAADKKQRDPTMNFLNVVVDASRCHISVYCNGHGIPIDVDQEEGIYMAEMIFGHLSDCDRNAEETTGYGVKLANIFSTEFVVEIFDSRCEKKYKQVSFVNKIATTAGGTHVDYVSNQIAARVAKFLNENLQGVNIVEHEVKRHLCIFINTLMVDPTFDSPTNETLTTPQERFGSCCELSDRFVEIVAECLPAFKQLP
ncbi:unnamed protein product [Urochloa decumbens]|uniref:DNA topoisomerase (ATP-hydrolyzing) n=1 Tax=Urochloa decumbens TaxID=240449 RepID=A0ABC9EC93_9POAL